MERVENKQRISVDEDVRYRIQDARGEDISDVMIT